MAKDRPFPHGTVNGYSNLHCRCQPCRDAWAAYHWDYMHNRHPEQIEKHRIREAARHAARRKVPA